LYSLGVSSLGLTGWAPNISTVSALNIVGISEETATNTQTAMVWLNPHVVKGDTGYA